MNDFFKDLKVIELASVLAGPAVGLFFAELGASVIKIENKTTNGDVTRTWKLPAEREDLNTSAYYQSVNWNKEVIFLDYKNNNDYLEALNYIKQADIVIANFKQGSAEKLKLDFETLKIHNKNLIYAEVSSYGEKDPRPGFDVVMQAETGWISMTGSKKSQAAKLPVALIDILTAHQLKEGILIALLNKIKIKKPQKVSVSLYDTSIASLANQASNYLNASTVAERIGTIHPNIAPYGDIVFTKDNKEIILSIGTQDQFNNLMLCLNALHLINDERFKDNKARVANRKELIKTLRQLFSEFESNDIRSKLITNKVPHANIKNIKEVFQDPKSKALVYESIENGHVVKRVKSVVFKIS